MRRETGEGEVWVEQIDSENCMRLDYGMNGEGGVM